MKTNIKFLAAAAVLTTSTAFAQTAGTWMARMGVTTITPQVDSGYLSAPDYMGGTKADVGSNTQLSGGITYMYTDHWAVDVPLAMPFTHKIIGDGALKGAGDLAEVKAIPFTVFLQYRFMEANAKFRPYVGLGATYAYFFDEQGSGKLTATTNPGGLPTKMTVDSKWALTPQIGATFAINDKWFVDLHYSKSFLKTTTHFSTGQHLDITLDPVAYGIDIGYKF
ncbi:outer membrane protein W [Rhodoferax lithotrophicus]|uniref:Outer membrane protein W n=1 Tax=Rhodoferax lithotrophicus TaxID=2798804 RepID=A0ABM7MRN0_9BURK|nr:OmpW family outer membrane protein [Rhodoferax sp. MIZ03]BCO28975.1 outer membrane protein W [Rhodoferax sp. MIZ03]